MKNVFIHPTSIVETDNIGENTYIGPFCFISKRTIIGKNCNIIGHSSIGHRAQWINPPEDMNGPIIIGQNTEIREFATINTPIGDTTTIGDSCYLMANCHVGHDSILENHVVLVVGAAIGGYSYIGKYSHIGLNASTHQYSKLGSYSMIGANSFFKGEAPDGIIWAGVPARPVRVNIINIEKNAPLELRQNIINSSEEFIKSKLI